VNDVYATGNYQVSMLINRLPQPVLRYREQDNMLMPERRTNSQGRFTFSEIVSPEKPVLAPRNTNPTRLRKNKICKTAISANSHLIPASRITNHESQSTNDGNRNTQAGPIGANGFGIQRCKSSSCLIPDQSQENSGDNVGASLLLSARLFSEFSRNLTQALQGNSVNVGL
jgi:hypothetical protein